MVHLSYHCPYPVALHFHKHWSAAVKQLSTRLPYVINWLKLWTKIQVNETYFLCRVGTHNTVTLAQLL